jgi:hypothetical protein
MLLNGEHIVSVRAEAKDDAPVNAFVGDELHLVGIG